jgi:hypothetical protein
MNASKEQARKALKTLEDVQDKLRSSSVDWSESLLKLFQVGEFIATAERKLPSEAAFKRAKAKQK